MIGNVSTADRTASAQADWHSVHGGWQLTVGLALHFELPARHLELRLSDTIRRYISTEHRTAGA